MSLAQLGRRLGLTPASVREIEEREHTGSITLKKLMEVGEALDMRFVYGFVPRHGSVDAMIAARALDVARDVVGRTSHSMKLEDQQISDERLRTAVENRAATLRREMPRYLWD
jgi:predicted DNA-binding mobile mystery protein A